MYRIFLALFIFTFSSFVKGQNVTYNFLSYKDGLSQATITCSMQDNLGFMWFGTRDGLNMYDGYNFTVYRNIPRDSTSLSSNRIQVIFQDKFGHIWVGTNFGLNRYHQSTQTFTSYYAWFADDNSISSNRVTAIEQAGDSGLWVGTENGLNFFNYSSQNFRGYFQQEADSNSISNNFITSLAYSHDKTLWIGTAGGLNRYNPDTDTFTRYRKKYEDQNSLSDNYVNSIHASEPDIIWIGTQNGLNKLNTEFGIFTRYFAATDSTSGLSANIINDVTSDEQGQIWIATSAGLDVFYVEQNVVRNLLQDQQKGYFSTQGILNILFDRSGLMWLGTRTAGIATVNLSAPGFQSFTLQDNDRFSGSPGILSFVEITKDSLLIGTTNGLYSFQPSTGEYELANIRLQPFTAIQKPVNSIIMAPDSVLWMGTLGGGLWRYDLSSQRLTNFRNEPLNRSSISSNKISQVLYDSEGTIWVGTIEGGLNKLVDEETGSFIRYTFQGQNPNSIQDNNILSLADAGHSFLWLGTSNAGLYRMNKNTGTLEHFSASADSTNGLPDNSIYCLHRTSDGILWIGTAGSGLSKYDPVHRQFVQYTTRDGLANNNVLSIIEDGRGNLWMSTNEGITVFNRQTQTFRNYNDQDILATNTYNNNSAYYSSTGVVYFGGINGFQSLKYQGLRENNYVPPVYITAMTSDEVSPQQQLSSTRTLIITQDSLILNYDHQGFTIEFAALNYIQPSRNQYAYRLEDVQKNWNYIGNRRYASFTNLSPGNYVFTVIASNNDGVWNNEGDKLYIIVKPAIWQTIYFKAGGILLVLIFIMLLYRYRLSYLTRQKQDLEELVAIRTQEISKERDTNAMLLREVHHRVKNNLQIITSLLSLQSRFISNQRVTNLLEEIQNRVRSMSLIHQKMYQTKDLSSVNIEEYIEDLSASLLQTYRLSNRIELDVQVEVNKFKSDTLTPLGLLINEVMSNSLKHAFGENQPGKIFVRLKKCAEDGQFQLIIGDNGTGIPENREIGKTNTFGTELIGALTEQLNGSIKRLRHLPGTVYEILFYDK